MYEVKLFVVVSKDTGIISTNRGAESLVVDFKGIVQPFKTGVMGGIIRLAFKFSSFPQFFKLFLKDPGPLNRKKRIRAVKQLSLGQVSILWRPLQKPL